MRPGRVSWSHLRPSLSVAPLNAALHILSLAPVMAPSTITVLEPASLMAEKEKVPENVLASASTFVTTSSPDSVSEVK